MLFRALGEQRREAFDRDLDRAAAAELEEVLGVSIPRRLLLCGRPQSTHMQKGIVALWR